MKRTFLIKLTALLAVLLGLTLPAQADVTLPAQLTAVEDYAFHENAAMTGHLEIPEGTESIGVRSFLNCTGLTSVTIPESVKYIGFEAFYGCTGLTGTVYIRADVEVGENAFGECPNLTVVYQSPEEAALEDLTYTVHEDEGFVTITGYNGDLTKLVIPAEIEGLPVKEIGSSAFQFNKTIEAIRLPETIETIDTCAFWQCRTLKEINIPSSVRTVCYGAFAYCSALQGSAVLVDVEVSNQAFLMTDQIQISSYTTQEDGTLTLDSVLNAAEELVIPEKLEGKTVTTIGWSAVAESSQLKSVRLPETITTIESYAFEGCTALETINIPASVAEIGYGSFRNCSKLTGEYSLLDVSMMRDSFSGCTGVKIWVYATQEDGTLKVTGCTNSDADITVPAEYDGKKVTAIGRTAFSEMSELQTLTLPEGIARMESYAVNACEQLTTLTLPESLAAVNGYAVSGCPALTGEYELMDVQNAAGMFMECPGVTLWAAASNEDGTCTLKVYDGVLTELVIPQKIAGKQLTAIGDNACSSEQELKSVVIPEGVKSIGSNAFYGSKMEQVTLPESLTSLGSCAFYYCDQLESIVLPKALEEVGYACFSYCPALTGEYYFTCGANAASVFEGSSQVTAWGFEKQEDGTLKFASYHGPSGELTVPGEVDGMKVTSAASYVFGYGGCPELTAINLPESITKLEYGAFYKCTGLSGKQEFVGVEGAENAFIECPDVTVYSYLVREDGTLMLDGYSGSETSIVVPDTMNGKTVTGLGYMVFAYMESLESITLPKSLNYMDYSFYGCSAISGEFSFVDVEGAENAFYNAGSDDVQVWTYTSNEQGGLTLSNYEGKAKEIVIPQQVDGKPVTVIGQSAFGYSDTLVSVTIPDGVTLIDKGAFWDCTALTAVDIPASVQKVEMFAFADCTALKDFNFEESTIICYDALMGTPYLTGLAQAIVDQVTDENDTPFEKAVAIHDWLVRECKYDLTYTYYAPEGMFLYRTGVCQAYAESYQMMLELVGIEVRYIRGTGNGGDHGWNLVKMDGDWYHVDCTWDDPIPDGHFRRTYCFIPDEVMAQDHWWEASDYPAATGTRYFRGEDTQK